MGRHLQSGKQGVGVGMWGLTETPASLFWRPGGQQREEGWDSLLSSCGLGFSPLSSDGPPGVQYDLQSLWCFPFCQGQEGSWRLALTLKVSSLTLLF